MIRKNLETLLIAGATLVAATAISPSQTAYAQKPNQYNHKPAQTIGEAYTEIGEAYTENALIFSGNIVEEYLNFAGDVMINSGYLINEIEERATERYPRKPTTYAGKRLEFEEIGRAHV